MTSSEHDEMRDMLVAVASQMGSNRRHTLQQQHCSSYLVHLQKRTRFFYAYLLHGETCGRNLQKPRKRSWTKRIEPAFDQFVTWFAKREIKNSKMVF